MTKNYIDPSFSPRPGAAVALWQTPALPEVTVPNLCEKYRADDRY